MQPDTLSAQQLQQGYSCHQNHFSCLSCGARFHQGQVYPIGEGLYTGELAAQMHLRHQHPHYAAQLINADSKYNTLTEKQRQLLVLLAEGHADKDIAAQLSLSLSTVRHQKFMFREKAKQATRYLAAYGLAFASREEGSAIAPIHDHANYVDDRYVITETERRRILNTSFHSLQPLKLAIFPRKEKKKVVILSQIAGQFTPGTPYTEAQVNEILADIYEDYVTLRRYLIDYGYMQRTPSGSEYRLTENLFGQAAE